MFTIFYTNFGYGPSEIFATADLALQYGKSKGFEFGIYDQHKELVGSWSPIGGYRSIVHR